MTTLYRPTDALTPEDRKVPGILITQYPRAMYLVPIEAEEQHVSPDAITHARYVTPWEET